MNNNNKRTAFVYFFDLVFERECKLQSRIISLLMFLHLMTSIYGFYTMFLFILNTFFLY